MHHVKTCAAPRTAALLLLALPLAVAAAADDGVSSQVTTEDEIVVTASRYGADDQMNVTNITNEDLTLREPDLGLPLLLQSLPGIYAYSDAGAGMGYTYLSVRGFDQRRVGVLFNGIPMNDPEDHQIWWVDLPDLAASVQDIQVQRGVTNSVGGMTAIGGTVNIISAGLAGQPQGRLAVSTGSFGTASQMISYQTGDLDGFRSSLRLSRQESDGFRDRSGHEGWAVFWSGQYDTENSTTRLNIYTGKELTHHAWDAVPQSVLAVDRTANMETYHNAIDDFRQPHYELHNTYYLGDDLALTNRLYYIQGEGFYENYTHADSVANYSLDHFLGLASDDEADLIRRKWVRKDHVGWVPSLAWNQPHGRLLVGGNWYTFHSNHWGEVLWVDGFTPADFITPLKYHEYVGDKDVYSVYANQRWDVSEDLTLTADLHFQHKRYRFQQRGIGNFRGDLLNAYTETWDFFNPKGSVMWRPRGEVAGGNLRLYGLVGVNNREPTDNELFDTWLGGDDLGVRPLFRNSRDVLNPDGSVAFVEWSDPYMQPEKVIDYEVGLAWQNRWLSWTLGGYWMDFTDEIVAYGGVNEDGSSIRGNAGKTLHRGLELGLRARVGRNHELALAASRSWDEFDEFLYHAWDGSVYDYSGNPIALFPEHLLMASWEMTWDDAVRSRVRLRNTGKQYLDNSGKEARTIDSWTTLDLSLWLDLAGCGLEALDGATAFVHARNVGDTEYEVWGYYSDWDGENFLTPAAGRNYIVGVDYDF